MSQFPELVGVTEIARIAEIGPTAVSNWLRRNSDFPDPIANLAQGKVWVKLDVLAWMLAHGKITLERWSEQVNPQ